MIWTDGYNGVDDKIEEFNSRHDLSVEGQLMQLMEEVGELAEVVNRDAPLAEWIEECADIEFVVRSILFLREAELKGVPDHELHQTAIHNLRKSKATDGSKVTDDAE